MIRLLFPLLLGLGTAAHASELPGFLDQDGDDDQGESGDDMGAPGDDGTDYGNNIVNGQLVGDVDYREVVFLGITAPSGGGNCTGSLLTPEWILTAAHCIPKDTTNIVIVVGADSQSLERYAAEEWIVHQGYKDTVFGDNDIAVVRLAEPITDIAPMGLNDQPITDDWLDVQVTSIGYGITRTNGGDGGTKRIADIPMVEYERDRIFTFDGNQAICQGDSGGPAVVFSGKTYVQVGIHSYGAVPCGSGWDGSVRVDYFLGWLRARGVEFQTGPGGPPTMVCSRELDPGNPNTAAVGVVPFELRCQLDYHAPEEITKVDWRWGDGNASEGTDAKHEYTTSGNFNLRMCATGTRDSGEWTHCVTRNGYVRACDIPDVAFEAEQIDGLLWQMRNRTDVSTYGCLTNVQWDIFDEGGELVESVASWEPEIEFPAKGTYRVVLNVGGLAGTGASDLTIDVKRGFAGGCSSLGGTAGFGGLGLLLALAVVRRRR